MRLPAAPARARAAGRGAAAAVALTGLAACSTPGAAPDQPVALTADVVETRAARSQATVSVALRNGGAAPVEVERLRLRSRAFEELPPLERPLTVPSGEASGRFFLPYGAPRCGERVTAVLVVSVRTADGVRDVEAPVTDRSPGLGRLHALACAAEHVTEQAEIGFADRWERASQDGTSLLRTTLRLERRGSEHVTVTRLDGNVVFSLAPAAAGSSVLALPPGQASAEAPVEVRASRCDPHALTESKRELLLSFRAFARVAGGPETTVSLRVPAAGEAAVLALMHDVCIAPLVATASSPAP